MEEYDQLIDPSTGFLTYGNASLLFFDNGSPILVTDPWIYGTVYFGSWALPVLPSKSLIKHLNQCKYVWISHGHPDHLHVPSLKRFINRDAIILLPDHFGKRIYTDLQSAGFCCQILKTGKPYSISQNLKIYSFPDHLQDAILVTQIENTAAVVNLNDSQSIVQKSSILPLIRGFQDRFALKLINFGDADVLTYCDKNWQIIKPRSKEDFYPTLGMQYSQLLSNWNCNFTSPFSSRHVYSHHRTEWLSDLIPTQEDNYRGFNHSQGMFIPDYFYYDAYTRSITPISFPDSRDDVKLSIDKSRNERTSISCLTKENRILLTNYFQKHLKLQNRYQAVGIYTEIDSFYIDICDKRQIVVDFMYPLDILIKSVKTRTFDNLLISNLGKVRISNADSSLHPSFAPIITRLGDNGDSFTPQQISRYYSHYRKIYNLEFIKIDIQEFAAGPGYNISSRLPFKPFLRKLWQHLLNML